MRIYLRPSLGKCHRRHEVFILLVGFAYAYNVISLFVQFNEKLQEWMQLNLSIIENHQMILASLMWWWNKTVQVRVKFSLIIHLDLIKLKSCSCEKDAANILDSLQKLDTIGICADLAVIVTNDTKYKQLLARRGTAAQAMIDIIQAVSYQSHSNVYVSSLLQCSA